MHLSVGNVLGQHITYRSRRLNARDSLGNVPGIDETEIESHVLASSTCSRSSPCKLTPAALSESLQVASHVRYDAC